MAIYRHIISQEEQQLIDIVAEQVHQALTNLMGLNSTENQQAAILKTHPAAEILVRQKAAFSIPNRRPSPIGGETLDYNPVNTARDNLKQALADAGMSKFQTRIAVESFEAAISAKLTTIIEACSTR